MKDPYGFPNFKQQREVTVWMSNEEIDYEKAEKIKFKTKYKRFHQL